MPVRSPSEKLMPPIAAFLERQLEKVAPDTVVSATSVVVHGEVAVVEDALRIRHPRNVGIVFYPKGDSLAVAIAENAEQKRFVHPGIHQEEFDAADLIDSVVSTAVNCQVSDDFNILRDAERNVGACLGLLKFAEHVLSEKFPNLPISVPDDKDGVSTIQIKDTRVTCKNGEWLVGYNDARDGLQAISFAIGNTIGAEVAAAYERESKEVPGEINFEKLWSMVADQASIDVDSDHGIEHWKRVERNGLLLATKTGADPTVMRLFAVFHDSRRENEYEDPDHGIRGAQLAQEWRGVHFNCTDEQMEKLVEACDGHTDGFRHDDPTVGSCWDSDRLDLGRVGIRPDAHYMSTEFARHIVRQGGVEKYLEKGECLPRFPAEQGLQGEGLDEIGGRYR